MLAFTTRIPLAVMIVIGIKQWGKSQFDAQRAAHGQCAITCSQVLRRVRVCEFSRMGEKLFPCGCVCCFADMGNSFPAGAASSLPSAITKHSYTPGECRLGRRLSRVVRI